MMPWSFRPLFLTFIAAGLLTGYGCSRPSAEGGRTDGLPSTAEPGFIGPWGHPDKQSRRIWADSFLFYDAPSLEVATWLTGKPEMEGKFVIIEFWRTWCGASRRVVPLLNSFHQRYGKELVIIAVTGESEETVKAYKGPTMDYAMAIDKPGTRSGAGATPGPVTDDQAALDGAACGGLCLEGGGVIKDQGMTEERFGVWGWPHVVILEPKHRCVIWEGYPLQTGYELTHETMDRILAKGRQLNVGNHP